MIGRGLRIWALEMKYQQVFENVVKGEMESLKLFRNDIEAYILHELIGFDLEGEHDDNDKEAVERSSG